MCAHTLHDDDAEENVDDHDVVGGVVGGGVDVVDVDVVMCVCLMACRLPGISNDFLGCPTKHRCDSTFSCPYHKKSVAF